MELPLSPELRTEILLQYKSTKDKRTANYLNIILLKDKNYSQLEISDILHLDENTICTWLKKFLNSDTLNTYLSNNYVGYVGKLAYCSLGKLVTSVKTRFLTNVKPLLTEVTDTFQVSYSMSGLTKLLKRVGFSYKKAVHVPAKLDPIAQANFVAEYADLKNQLTPKCAIFFMDGVHPQHNTHAASGWFTKGEPAYIPSNTGRNRLNINGLYNPANQDVIVTEHKTLNAQAVIETFEKLKKAYPTHENLYVFADNAKYYVATVLKDYLAQNPVIKLKHLPTYSPNLNLIERLWKFLKKEVTHTTYYEKFEGFKNAIKNFFENIYEQKEKIKQFVGEKFRLFTQT